MRIANEEDGGVVAHQIPVAFFGIKLNGKATHITLTIGGTFFSSNRRETQKHFCLLADFREKLRFGVFRYGTSDGKRSIRTRTFGMNDSFWNPLSVELLHLLHKLHILHQQGATRASGQGILVISNWATRGGGQLFAIAHRYPYLTGLRQKLIKKWLQTQTEKDFQLERA